MDILHKRGYHTLKRWRFLIFLQKVSISDDFLRRVLGFPMEIPPDWFADFLREILDGSRIHRLVCSGLMPLGVVV
ncbi:hypothetical protein KA005_58765, partial [bacterium]|nr:hypothetical protein [bacterium]